MIHVDGVGVVDLDGAGVACGDDYGGGGSVEHVDGPR